MIGWMNNWDYGGSIPTSPWRSAMTVPRELSLQNVDGTDVLVQQPVAQLNQLTHGAGVARREPAHCPRERRRWMRTVRLPTSTPS